MILDIVSKLQLGWCPISQLLWWSLLNYIFSLGRSFQWLT